MSNRKGQIPVKVVNKFYRFGAGTKGPVNMLSQYMLGSAASFGFFMGKFI